MTPTVKPHRWIATCYAFAFCALALPSTAAASDDILNTREINITGKYLLFPVSNNGQRGRMTVRVGEQLVHNLDCDFAPNKDSIDW